MDPSESRIEIFAPFGEAFEVTKKVLFQPFDLTKWFVIGFAAWLATMFSGTSFNYRRSWGDKDWNWKGTTSGNGFSMHDSPPWLIPVIIGGGLLLLALVILLVWLNARGRFMFTHCIVRNRGAIAEPWREYRPEGNRYFVLALVISLCSMFVFGGLALVFVLGRHWNEVLFPLPLLILAGVAFLLLALVIGLIMKFMVPVMYRQRCAAGHAFGEVWRLIAANPVSFLLFGLFYIVLYIAIAMMGCLATCVTCCVAAIPYIGTVLLLPLVMFLFTYPLCFIRQFGDPYDVWAGVTVNELPPPAAEPPPVPPVQDPLPPA